MNVVPNGKNTRLPHATPDATLTMIARSNVGTSNVIVIAIALRTMNTKRRSTLVSSALAIATGRMTVATISLNS